MVATLLRLRFQVLANSLRRSAWQLVATIIGALYALGLLGLAVAGTISLGLFAPAELTTTIIVLVGSAVTLAWVLLPLIATGIDQTLDPARLAQYPIPKRTLLIALTLAGVVGVPGIVTSLAALSTVAAWLRDPLAAVAALIGAVVAVLTAVVASRTVAAASVSLQSNRRVRELGGIVILVPLFLLGPIILGLTQGLSNSVDALPQIASALGWTPVGAAWAVSGAVAAGDLAGAGLRLLIALATLGVLAALWRVALTRALVTPSDSGAGSARSRRGIGVFAIVPQTPAGAVMARCLTYWRRDPRYLRQLVFVPLVPLLLWFYATLTGGAELLLWSGPFIAFLLALVLTSDISYDGTAFATHLIDAVRGRDDRIGRVAAVSTFAFPVTVVIVVGAVAYADRWDWLPMLLGLSLGVLLTGLGVVSVSSARFVMPVPQAGDNPFKAAPGANLTTGLQSFVVLGIALALLVPTGILALGFVLTGAGAFGWATLVAGVVIGAVVLVIGLRSGGALLDRTGPTLLASLRRMRGA